MRQWEIWTFDFTAEDTHPVVILSNNSRIASPDLERVNVLFWTELRKLSCDSLRAYRRRFRLRA